MGIAGFPNWVYTATLQALQLMKTLLLLLLASVTYAKGPKYNFTDPKMNDELENVYHDISNVLTGSTVTIRNLNVSSITVNGSSVLGRVKQFVTFTDESSDSTTSSSFQATGLTASITPTSTSSKILVIAASTFRTNSGSASEVMATIYRGSTDIGGTGTGIATLLIVSAVAQLVPSTMIVLDSPSSTSSVTYTVRIRNSDAATAVQYGRGGNQKRVMILIELL